MSKRKTTKRRKVWVNEYEHELGSIAWHTVREDIDGEPERLAAARREAAEEKAEEGVRYWTDLAQAEARDAAALRTRVAELEAQWGEAVAALRGLMSVVDGGESGVAQVVDASNSARAVLAKYPEGR